MLHFNFNSTEPIYLQVANQLEEAIFTKAFLDGTQVPSTTEISKEFHINPATVLKGMNILVNDGLLEKRRGLGMVIFSLVGRRGWNKMDMLRENPLHLTLRMEVEPIPIRERLQDPL